MQATHLAFVSYPSTIDSEPLVEMEESSLSLLVYLLGPDGPQGELQTLFSTPISPDCDIDHVIPSPNSSYLLLEYSCHANSFIQLLNLTNLTSVPFTLERGYFLNWSPDGNWFLFRHIDTDQILLVASDGTTQVTLKNLPFGTYNATFSLDGQTIIYAATPGLGLGSEMGILNLVDNSLVVQKKFPAQIVGFPRWSPDGAKLAYILLTDTNTPYTIGELWVTNTTESTDILLGEVDAGRGYPPIWGTDGSSLVYIHRENPASLQANYRAEALYSNIYQVDLTTYQVSPLTQFTNTLVYDAVWSPNGSQLAFTAGDAVWLLEPGQSPMQLTSPGIARHPAWITLPTP